MLKKISSVISPDLLWLLASMGHGDDLVLPVVSFLNRALSQTVLTSMTLDILIRFADYT